MRDIRTLKVLTPVVMLAVALIPFSPRSFAQSKPMDGPTKLADAVAEPPTNKAPDFKQLVAQTDVPSEKVDTKALEKIGRQQPRKEGMTATQKWALALGIIGTAVIVFVLVKNADSACVVTGQSGCVAVNDRCTCGQPTTP